MNFSYFDQFPEIEIDFSDYINNFPATSGYSVSNRQPVKTKIKNLFVKYELDINFKKNIQLLEKYHIEDNELPEAVSYKKYSTIDFWWLILVFNNIQDPLTEWPLNQNQINMLADDLVQKEGKYTKAAYVDFLFERNELKRTIWLPKPTVLDDIIWQYQSKILGA